MALLPTLASQAFAQTPAQAQVPTTRTTVLVTAQRDPADPATLPVAVTAITEDLLRSAGVTFISDAALFSPNTHFTEFSARKLSNPRIRGIGASPANPGVVTYVDGVPQFNASSTSFDFVDVSQVEFVRGPESALFGRNALGGVINIASALPSVTEWTGQVAVPLGSDALVDVRANASGPLGSSKVAAGMAVAYSRRDGFTRNVLTGHDLDYRDAFSAKGQVLWTPTPAWEARVIVSGERARDGDYALADLAAVRTTPFEVARDFEGHTDRDLVNTTVLATYQGAHVTFASTTGVVRWKTVDATDLDYSPLPLATRDNTEEATQFTQEVRLASAAGKPVAVSDGVTLRWQAGALVFTQGYTQSAFNTIAPYVLSPFVGFTVVQTSPQAALDDVGVGIYGQGTVGFGSRVNVTAGARFDYEQRDADILTAYDPMIAPPVSVNESRSFDDVSPQVAVTVRLGERALLYGNVARAFKAGGFNPVSPPDATVFGEEHAWSVEGGVKASAAGGRFTAAAAVFAIDWQDMQLNLPMPGAPGQFYIDNAGGATSRGVEGEVTVRPLNGLDLLGAVGVTRARFDAGVMLGGDDISGHKVANTPAFTTTFAAQYSREFRPGHRLFGRVDVVTTGAFEYDEANTVRQDAYTITNVRGGLRLRRVTVEAWIRNAFDTRYVPLAFMFPGFTPSGFLAEPGRPRTWGVTAGIGF
jgi:iron complex outermembrane receptor protein